MRALATRFHPAIISASLLILACGEKELNAPTPDLGGAGGTVDVGGAGGEAPSDSGTVDAAGGAGGSPGQPLVPYPNGCESDEDCPALCLQGICVDPPPSDRNARFSCDNAQVPDSAPALGCWMENPSAPAGPASVRLYGKAIYFGEGVQTIGLTVRLYNFETFDPSACLDAAEGIQDLMVARERTEACIDENATPLATTETVECNPPDSESACYSLDGVPTNKLLVARVTGDLEQWVPTYAYGVYVDACDAPGTREEAGICPEEVAGATGDWQCDVLNGDSAYRDMTVISQATWTSFPPTAGIARIELGNGAVAGRQYDCEGRSVVNAGFALANPGRKQTFFNGDPDDTLPQPGLTFTNTRGTYADLDTPPGPNGLVAVAWQSGDLKLVGYDRFFVLPNTVVILNPNGRPAVITAPPY